MVKPLGLAQGIWVDGRISKEELAHLQELMKKAVKKFGKKELPWSYEDDKITLRAWESEIRKGGLLSCAGKPPWSDEDV